jgi:hypothetical protein
MMHNIRSAASKIKPLSKNKDARVLFENFMNSPNKYYINPTDLVE